MTNLENKPKEKKDESKTNLTSPKEKKNQQKEKNIKTTKNTKNILPKYYGGTEVVRLPKITKAMLKDMQKMENVSMTQEQLKGYLTSVAIGLIPDKFGLDAGLDTKLKALQMLSSILANEKSNSSDDSKKQNDFIDAITQDLLARPIDDVDEVDNGTNTE